MRVTLSEWSYKCSFAFSHETFSRYLSLIFLVLAEDWWAIFLVLSFKTTFLFSLCFFCFGSQLLPTAADSIHNALDDSIMWTSSNKTKGEIKRIGQHLHHFLRFSSSLVQTLANFVSWKNFISLTHSPFT